MTLYFAYGAPWSILARASRSVAGAGYVDVVIAAALEWRLPAPYIEELRTWSLRRPQRLRAFRWT